MGKELRAENLAEQFGADTSITKRGVAVLCRAAAAAEPPALANWKTFFPDADGYDLFALHTYYAMLVRLLVERCCGIGADDSFGNGLFGDDLFSWYASVRREPLQRLNNQLAAKMAEYDPPLPGHPGGDLLQQLYHDLVPRPLRHELGEYYTPDWLTQHVLDQIAYTSDTNVRLLDPACGSGTFLVAAIRRILATARLDAAEQQPGNEAPAPETSTELCRKIFASVVGFDLNPLAVMAAKANYLIALRGLLPKSATVEIPVYLRDSILAADRPYADGPDEPFDCVVGNPPWIAWDNLPTEYRRASLPLWQRYGLFSLSGTQGRHGGSKKDLAMLMIYTAADRYLRDGGRLAMVVTQTLFQNKGAGDGFRRFRLGPEGQWLGVLRVDDMVALRPFHDTANRTATLLLEKGTPTQYPVPYVKWSPGDGAPRQLAYEAEPIEPSNPGSPWFLRPAGLKTTRERLVGRSDYTAHLGANSGGANGVYWVEALERSRGGILIRNLAGRGKRAVEEVCRVVEPELLYPLLRWGDVSRYRATPSAHILLVQDVVTRTGIDETLLRRRYAQTHAYFEQFGVLLRGRAAYRRYQDEKPFYSMYNVGTYTVAPIKVVWRRMDRRINAAVVEPVEDPLLGTRPAIPQETCVLIECGGSDEAHYACAVLNSSIVNFLVAAHSISGGKGFGTPSMLDYIRLQRFDPADRRHLELAACSRQAHRLTAEGVATAIVQQLIDRLVGELWGLEESELRTL